jgi:two-component system, cell cycle sensor histidine kinase and response regulator CckA
MVVLELWFAPRSEEVRSDSLRRRHCRCCCLPGDLPLVEADRSQVQQLVMNLAINAAESIEGSGAVSIATAMRERPDGPSVVLEVRDNGCGMDEATKARIFDPFFSTKFTGRGLGLAAVMGIIRAHHGEIEVESEHGRGSTFRVILPAVWRQMSESDMMRTLPVDFDE